MSDLTIIGGRVTSTTPTLAADQGYGARMTTRGELIVAAGSPAVAPTAFFAANSTSDYIDTGAFEVVSVACMNPGASLVYLQLFDTEGAPLAGDTPLACFIVPASGGVLVDSTWFAGLRVSQGLAWGISSTPATFTVVGAFTGCVSILHRPG